MSLSPLVVDSRDKLVRDEMQVRGASIDSGLLVVDLNNIRWLTGFTGSAGTLIVRPDDMVLVVDGRYGDQAREQTKNSGANCEVIEGRSAVALREALAGTTASLKNINFDAGELTVAQLESMTEQLSTELRKIAPIVPKLRRRKTEPEIQRMQLAALATEPFTIDAWFNSYYLAYFERLSKPSSHPRHFMNLQTHPMTGAVRKFRCKTSLGYIVATSFVYILGEHTRFDRCQAEQL